MLISDAFEKRLDLHFLLLCFIKTRQRGVPCSLAPKIGAVEQAQKRRVPPQGSDVDWPSAKRWPEGKDCFCLAAVVRNAHRDVDALSYLKGCGRFEKTAYLLFRNASIAACPIITPIPNAISFASLLVVPVD